MKQSKPVIIPARPLCPACAKIMRHARIILGVSGLPELHNYECRPCGVAVTLEEPRHLIDDACTSLAFDGLFPRAARAFVRNWSDAGRGFSTLPADSKSIASKQKAANDLAA
jgi:hypothetical protein